MSRVEGLGLVVCGAEVHADASAKESYCERQNLINPVPSDFLENAEENNAQWHENNKGTASEDCVGNSCVVIVRVRACYFLGTGRASCIIRNHGITSSLDHVQLKDTYVWD